MALHPERTHPSPLVADAVEGHATLAARKGVALRSTVAEDVPEVDVDPSRIRQVLANLLSNAVRHTPPGGEVGVDVTVDGDAVRFVVVDSGPGFPPEALATVFDRFTQSADSGGSGRACHLGRRPGGGRRGHRLHCPCDQARP